MVLLAARYVLDPAMRPAPFFLAALTSYPLFASSFGVVDGARHVQMRAADVLRDIERGGGEDSREGEGTSLVNNTGGD